MNELVTKRNYGLDLLKIIAMVWIILFHFGPYNILNTESIITGNWIILDFAGLGGAVGNCIFVLISGYFLYDSRFKLRKIFKLLLMVLFYTLISIVISAIYGSVKIGSICDLLRLLLSFVNYWFFDYYILLYLLFPLLNRFINRINRTMHLVIIIVMCIVFNFIPTVCMISYSSKAVNMLSVWITFLELYLMGAFARRINYKGMSKRKIFLGCIAVTLIMLAMASVYLLCRINYIDCSYFIWKMDKFLPIIIALVLFLLFCSLEFKERNNLIEDLAADVFAVYLLHTGLAVDFFSMYLLNAKISYHSPFMIIYMLVSTIALFAITLFIELFRKKIEYKIFDKFEHGKGSKII